jgi:hypothetical protein
MANTLSPLSDWLHHGRWVGSMNVREVTDLALRRFKLITQTHAIDLKERDREQESSRTKNESRTSVERRHKALPHILRRAETARKTLAFTDLPIISTRGESIWESQSVPRPNKSIEWSSEKPLGWWVNTCDVSSSTYRKRQWDYSILYHDKISTRQQRAIFLPFLPLLFRKE